MDFSKLVVLELANVLAGPLTGMFFAELGATVIKVENPHTNGDATRKWKLPAEDQESDISAYFVSANWGKQSIAIDLHTKEGISLLHQLVEKSDIVISSYKPGDAKKLKADYESLKKINNQIIYGQITGYGDGDSRAGYDGIIQAESGFMHLNGQPDDPPTKMPVALIDILTAHQLKEGILIALLEKVSTKKGKYVSCSLMDTALSSLANQASNWLTGHHNPQRMGSEHPNIFPYGTIFKDKNDILFTIAIGTDKQFKCMCEILNISCIQFFNKC